MGASKALMEHYEEQERVAIRIAIEADVLQRCEHHADFVFCGGSDVVGAYKLGQYKFKKDELKGVFETPLEMTNTIKKVVQEHEALDECQRCAKMLAD
jgi:hypothetical protein